MKIVFVDTEKAFVKEFEESFKLTNRVSIFNDMLDAYKWIKIDENIPEVIVTELDINESTGLQSLKFLLTKSKLKNTAIVGFTNHEMDENEKNLILNEGASEVFEKKNLISGLSTYLKYLSDPSFTGRRRPAGEKTPHKGETT